MNNILYSLQMAEFTPNLNFVYLGVFSTPELAKSAAFDYQKANGDDDKLLIWKDFEYDSRFFSNSKRNTGDAQEPYFTIEEDWIDELR